MSGAEYTAGSSVRPRSMRRPSLRRVLARLLVLCALPHGAVAAAEAALPAIELNDDGLHTHSWFLTSLLELHDDMTEAAATGKDLVIIWEQRGCPYCTEMHEVNLRVPEVVSYIRENFGVLQLNLTGDRHVTDTDGEVLAEKDLARPYGVPFTPTIQFFSRATRLETTKSARELEVWRLAGYWKPFHFLSSFVYVHESGYLEEPRFQRWLKSRIEALRAAGKEVEVW